MKRENIKKFLQKCAELKIPSNIALGILAKKAGLEKLSKHLIEKKAGLAEYAVPTSIAAALGGYLYGSSGKNDMLLKQKLMEEKLKQVANLGSWTSAAGLGGGTLGYIYGEDLFPNLDPSGARILGSVTGGLAGAMSGNLLGSIVNQTIV